MKKHKNKILIGLLMTAVLIALWFMSGTAGAPTADNATQAIDAVPSAVERDEPELQTISAEDFHAVQEPTNASKAATAETSAQAEITYEPSIDADRATEEAVRLTSSEDTVEPSSIEPAIKLTDEPITAPAAEPAATAQSADGAEIAAELPATATITTSDLPAVTQALTQPSTASEPPSETAAEGIPQPYDPENATIGSGSFAVTLSVRCDELLANLSSLKEEKRELVPSDGLILAPISVIAYEGESVFNVLRREMKRAKIHMEFVNTPIYNSTYIEGINNIYEFDAGELSGWMYKVNGQFPNYGCSRYELGDGDVIEWVYTCDLGRDVGGFYASGE